MTTTAEMIIEDALDWDGRITLWNASCEVLSSNYSWKKAMRLLSLEKAVVVVGEWIRPRVLQLKEWIYIPWERLNANPRVSRSGVLKRDGRICQYCGGLGTTIDHVTPRSLGGKNLWQNLVAACERCNHKKGNKTLEESGMHLLRKPYIPTKRELHG